MELLPVLMTATFSLTIFMIGIAYSEYLIEPYVKLSITRLHAIEAEFAISRYLGTTLVAEHRTLSWRSGSFYLRRCTRSFLLRGYGGFLD